MKFYDSFTRILKTLQDGDLSVYIETDSSKKYYVTTKDHHLSLHQFDTREKAVEFCRYLNINIIAFINHKL